MVEKILNNTTPYGEIRASHEGSLHSSTFPVKKRDHDYITVTSQTSHKCEVIIKTSQ